MRNTTPNYPPPPPQSPVAKKSRVNSIIIVSAAALIAAIITTGVIIANNRDNSTASAAESTPADTTTTTTITAAAEPEPTPEDTEPEVMGLTDGVAYEDGVGVTLSGYKRGTSSEYAAPGGTPYVAFTVKIDNKSDAIVDIGTGYVMCYYGDDSSQAEQIFDSERNMDGLPTMKLRPGRTAKATVACEMPKSESYLQVELAPSMESEVAIFAGNVK